MISSNFNDEKFKNITKSRKEWIDTGKEVLKDVSNSINDLTINSLPNRKV